MPDFYTDYCLTNIRQFTNKAKSFIQNVFNMYLADKYINMWDTGIKAGKGGGRVEFVEKFNARFGYTSERTLARILDKEKEPTPDEYEWLVEMIEKYWAFYNPKEKSNRRSVKNIF